jgi:hypothetical protein
VSAPSPVPCRYCPAFLVWAKSEKGNAMCFDAEPSPRGRWDIAGPTALYVKAGDEKSGVPLFESHWANCSGRAKARADHPKAVAR